MDKPAWKSLSIGSAVVYGVIGVLETNGLIPEGTSAKLAETVQNLAVIGGVWGLRRAVG